jgi:glutaconate CoA-transferase subunit A
VCSRWTASLCAETKLASRRADKLLPLEEAVTWVDDGSLLGTGGVLQENRPMALERAMLRKGVKGLRLIGLSASGYDADLLIAAGAVSETYIPAVTFEAAGLAPTFRRAVERGDVVAHGVDVTTVLAGYFASAEGLPFHPVAALKGTDLLKVNPLLKPLRSPFDGSEIWAVEAIAPDVSFIHAQEADCFGNARILGPSAYGESLLAKASKRVVLSCDRLVEPETIMADPMRTTIAGIYVDAVVHLPYGAHPTSSPGLYAGDRAHIDDYWARAEHARKTADSAGLGAYLQTYVFDPPDHDAYLGIVGEKRLHALEH